MRHAKSVEILVTSSKDEEETRRKRDSFLYTKQLSTEIEEEIESSNPWEVGITKLTFKLTISYINTIPPTFNISLNPHIGKFLLTCLLSG